jgi:hypothetical protein
MTGPAPDDTPVEEDAAGTVDQAADEAPVLDPAALLADAPDTSTGKGEAQAGEDQPGPGV